jgi:hypothetical protein
VQIRPPPARPRRAWPPPATAPCTIKTVPCRPRDTDPHQRSCSSTP